MNDARSAFFCAVFLLLLFVYAVIVVPLWMSESGFSSDVLNSVIAVAPVIMGDVAVIGDYTPPILAAAMTALAPPRTRTRLFWGSFVIVSIAYAAYVHLTILFSSDTGQALLGLDRDLEKAQAVVVPLTEGARTFCLVTAAGLLGLKINEGQRG